jgi:hypothetical protein
MRLVGMSFVVGLLAVGCDASPEQQRRDVCTAYCECETSTPLALEGCITDTCLPLLPSASEDCVSCVYTYSQTCGDLFDQCSSECFSNVP